MKFLNIAAFSVMVLGASSAFAADTDNTVTCPTQDQMSIKSNGSATSASFSDSSGEWHSNQDIKELKNVVFKEAIYGNPTLGNNTKISYIMCYYSSDLGSFNLRTPENQQYAINNVNASWVLNGSNYLCSASISGCSFTKLQSDVTK